MSVSKIENYGTTESLTWLRDEIEKRNQQIIEKDQIIAKNWEKFANLERIEVENNHILNSLAAQEAEQNEEQSKILEKIESLEIQFKQKQKKDREAKEKTETSNKVAKAIGGVVVIGLIATGIAIGIIRYA
jgi:hypothetical protein